MSKVLPKKHFGQHFLIDEEIIHSIVQKTMEWGKDRLIIEVGPGQGALTQHLYQLDNYLAIEIDGDCIAYLKKKYPKIEGKIIHIDFLECDLQKIINGRKTVIVGNFPYNISTPIIFKILETKENIEHIIGMFQKEVSDRIISKEGSKNFAGISIFTQLYYEANNLCNVPPSSFYPPPKVDSSVITLSRAHNYTIDFDEKLFKRIVKEAFGQRRKMLRNNLKGFLSKEELNDPIYQKRAEQMNIDFYIALTKKLSIKK